MSARSVASPGWSYESEEWPLEDHPDHPDWPIVFFFELDDQGRVRRVVQMFHDGALGFATGFVETPGTHLPEGRVDLANPDQRGVEISRDEFDAWWLRALSSSEAWPPRRDGPWLPLVCNYLPRALTAFEGPDYLYLETVPGDRDRMVVHRLREDQVLGSCAFDAVGTIARPLGVVLVDELVFSRPPTRSRNVITPGDGAVHVDSIAPV